MRNSWLSFVTSAATLCLLLGAFSSRSVAQDCPSEPAGGLSTLPRTLVVALLDRTQQNETWQHWELTSESSPHLGFNQNPVCFYYRVQADRRTTTEAALAVLVTREYSETMYGTDVRLYRGDGFFDRRGSAKSTWSGQVSDRAYENFHNRRRPNRDFETDFHGYWCSDSREECGTASPPQRRTEFVYSTPASETHLRRTYLLHYTTSSLGSWIPFYVEPGDYLDLEIITVTVKEIGAFANGASIGIPTVVGRVCKEDPCPSS